MVFCHHHVWWGFCASKSCISIRPMQLFLTATDFCKAEFLPGRQMRKAQKFCWGNGGGSQFLMHQFCQFSFHTKVPFKWIITQIYLSAKTETEDEKQLIPGGMESRGPLYSFAMWFCHQFGMFFFLCCFLLQNFRLAYDIEQKKPRGTNSSKEFTWKGSYKMKERKRHISQKYIVVIFPFLQRNYTP